MARHHHGRADVQADAPERSAHLETDAPQAMVDRLLSEIGRVFYATESAQRWLQDQKPLIEALTWPAVWLNERGVGMPAGEYESKVREIVNGIAQHGDLARIKYFPAYLRDCIRKHFIHHGDEIYADRKHVRTAFDLAFLKGAATPVGPADVVPGLVAAHAVLATARRAKRVANDDRQGSLF